MATNHKSGRNHGKSARLMIRIFFLIYLVILMKVIVFKYPLTMLESIAESWRRDVILEGLSTANFVPFKTIRMYIVYADRLNSVENLVGNVVSFIPFGIFMPMLYKSSRHFGIMMLQAFILVLGIELFQLFSAFGAFDVDDIILNCAGVAIGFVCYKIGVRIRRK